MHTLKALDVVSLPHYEEAEALTKVQDILDVQVNRTTFGRFLLWTRTAVTVVVWTVGLALVVVLLPFRLLSSRR